MNFNSIEALFGLAAAFVGLFGWSHNGLTKRLTKVEDEIADKPDISEIRLLVEDKLAPQKLELHLMHSSIDDLRASYRALDKKLDKVLDICTRIQNGKQ